MVVRTSGRRDPRVRGLRALSGGRGAGQGREGASELHRALVAPSPREIKQAQKMVDLQRVGREGGWGRRKGGTVGGCGYVADL